MIKTTNLNVAEFNEYISKPELSNDDFIKIFEELNDVYIKISYELFNKNNDRNEIIDKMKKAEKNYKKKLKKKKLEINNDYDDFINNFEELSSMYVEILKEIINKNNDRTVILDKIRIVQKIYKKNLK